MIPTMWRSRTGVMVALVSFLVAVCAVAGEVETDLAKEYPATLDWSEDAPARDWTSGPGDVWKLKSFSYEYNGLRVECGPATVVFGVRGGNVLWAALMPAEAGRLRSSVGEETFDSLWMRFHPGLIGELFPAATVECRGEFVAQIAARRMAQHKLVNSMQWDNLPVVPKRDWLVFDAQTPGGERRFFFVDRSQNLVKHEPVLNGRAMPPPPGEPISRADALLAFDTVWESFDREYAMFALRPEVDWVKVKETCRPLAERATTAYEAAGAIALMLEELRDLHIWVKAGEVWMPGYNRFRPLNANKQVTFSHLTGLSQSDKELAWGKTADNIGYIVVGGLTSATLPDAFDAALEGLKETEGLIVDLRFNGGGNETLGQQMAGRFTTEARVYSFSRWRSGPGHGDLTAAQSRSFEPRGPWCYEKPVVCLQGRKTMSSAESFVKMFAQCPGVTTLGAPTAGSSGNPRRLDLPGGITVNMPRWIDLDETGKPLDEAGAAPDVPVDVPPTTYWKSDPVMDKALEMLREKIGEQAVKEVKISRPLVSITGRDSKIKERMLVRVTSEEEWKKLFLRHIGKDRENGRPLIFDGMPDVDFDRCMVVAVFDGESWNSGGVVVKEILEDENQLIVRYRTAMYQSGGDEGSRVTPYGLFVIPRSNKEMALEEDIANHMQTREPEWEEQVRFPALGVE